MPTTLYDVAKLAGVSISTASRALYGSRTRPSALETQRRVWEAAHQLQYVPPQAARTSFSHESAHYKGTRVGNIGVVLGNVSYKFADPFWTMVIEGIDRETTRQGHHLRFNFTLDDLQYPQQRQLLSIEHIDGLIVIGGHDTMLAFDSLTDWIQNDDMRKRTVLIEGGDDRFYRNQPLEVDVITCDKRYVIYQLVEHLVTLGHRRIAFLGPRLDHDERGASFIQALAFNNVPFDPSLFFESPWSIEESYPVAQEVMRSGAVFDALICGCDAVAISATRAARESGKNLPADLAIAGFDDIEFARHMHPALTTAHVNKELLGELAVRKLIERINRPDLSPVIQIVPTTLVKRESCGELLTPHHQNTPPDPDAGT